MTTIQEKTRNRVLALRTERLKLSLSQRALAEMVGLHVHTLSKLERGERSPSLETHIALRQALKMQRRKQDRHFALKRTVSQKSA